MNDLERQERRAQVRMWLAVSAFLVALTAFVLGMSVWFVVLTHTVVVFAFGNWFAVYLRAADGHARATEPRDEREGE